jgi:hypothetical protein
MYRARGWGGYSIPECDCTSDSLRDEMMEAGALSARTYAHSTATTPARESTSFLSVSIRNYSVLRLVTQVGMAHFGCCSSTRSISGRVSCTC